MFAADAAATAVTVVEKEDPGLLLSSRRTHIGAQRDRAWTAQEIAKKSSDQSQYQQKWSFFISKIEILVDRLLPNFYKM